MSNEVLISLIVAGAGVALAAVGFLIAVIAKVAASRAQRELDEFRQEYNQVRSARWMQDKEVEGAVKVRRAMLEGAQKIKNELTGILHAKEGNLKKEAAYKAISDAGRAFTTLCDDHAGKLEADEKAAMLRARDAAVEATYQTRSIMDEVKDPANLTAAQREVLARLRAELSEAQSVLRDRIQDRLTKRLLSEGE